MAPPCGSPCCLQRACIYIHTCLGARPTRQLRHCLTVPDHRQKERLSYVRRSPYDVRNRREFALIECEIPGGKGRSGLSHLRIVSLPVENISTVRTPSVPAPPTSSPILRSRPYAQPSTRRRSYYTCLLYVRTNTSTHARTLHTCPPGRQSHDQPTSRSHQGSRGPATHRRSNPGQSSRHDQRRKQRRRHDSTPCPAPPPPPRRWA